MFFFQGLMTSHPMFCSLIFDRHPQGCRNESTTMQLHHDFWLSIPITNPHHEPVLGHDRKLLDLGCCFLSMVEELCNARYNNGSFSLINMESVFHCLCSLLFDPEKLRQKAAIFI
jgi:hypothetical protein